MRFWMVCCTLCVGVNAENFTENLPAKPCGIGHPASDRAWWDGWAKTPESTSAIKKADSWLKQTMPPFDRERYLDYTTNGDRTRYQAQHSRRWDRFKCLVLGECLEGKGRFIPAINETVRNLCADPSWILPAHDPGAGVLNGASPYVDLAVAANGYEMALASWLLDGRLPAQTLALMRENVSKRLMEPIFQTIDGSAPKNVIRGHWWMRADHNWNAVCTAGAMGAILTIEPSREKRTQAVMWSRKNMDVFLSGFAKDGYCSEGLGYWNYGFGHYIVLAELLRAQTGGRMDLYQPAVVRTIASAPAMLELGNGVYPAFADCGLDAKPENRMVELVRWRLAKQPFTDRPSASFAEGGQIYQTLTWLAARSEVAATKTEKTIALPPSSWFPDSGVCVARPSESGGMAAAWKGGHNGEHHNHNDVGTTIVTWKGNPIIADPGAMVYRAETFSKDRYRLPVLSSYGHSVPVIAGRLQAEGAKCEGKVINTSFTTSLDSVTIDLSSAYPGCGLKKLERQWTYRREGDGILAIEDRFSYEKASTFATALVGLGDWYLVEGTDRKACFRIDGGKGAVLQVDVVFSSPGAWEACKIQNPGKPTAIRLGLALRGSVVDGSIQMIIRPSPGGVPKDANKLPAGYAPEKLKDARFAP